MQSDEQLIAELRQGKESFMEVLVKRHYKSVFAYIYRQMGDYHTAYDLTQETFIKMVRGINSFTGKGKFIHWLLAIALNTCRDHVKTKGYKSGRNSTPWNDEVESADSKLINYFEYKTEEVLIKEALQELPSYQREAIVLRYYHDLKMKDIAGIMAVGEATVKSRIHQGLTKLKSIMERGEKDGRQSK